VKPIHPVRLPREKKGHGLTPRTKNGPALAMLDHLGQLSAGIFLLKCAIIGTLELFMICAQQICLSAQYHHLVLRGAVKKGRLTCLVKRPDAMQRSRLLWAACSGTDAKA
jgi:hypothetical protein